MGKKPYQHPLCTAIAIRPCLMAGSDKSLPFDPSKAGNGEVLSRGRKSFDDDED